MPAKPYLVGALSPRPVVQTFNGNHFFVDQHCAVLTRARVGFPAWLLTATKKPSGGDAVLCGCFATWNSAYCWLVEHRPHAGEESFRALESWLIETATVGLAESVKRTFQPTPPSKHLVFNGGTFTPDDYIKSVPMFAQGAQTADAYIAQQEAAAAARAPRKSKETYASTLKSFASADGYNEFVVGIVPALGYWTVSGVARNTSVLYPTVCEMLEPAALPFIDQSGNVRVASGGGKISIKSLSKWGGSADAGVQRAGKKRPADVACRKRTKKAARAADAGRD